MLGVLHLFFVSFELKGPTRDGHRRTTLRARFATIPSVVSEREYSMRSQKGAGRRV